MRRLLPTAFLALPLLLFTVQRDAAANPLGTDGFGFRCGGPCLKMFPHIHQHGPLYNYGPYYGYYPFAPYGPWDQYLRYDPNFYGDQNADGGGGNYYGRNPNLPYLGGLGGLGRGLGHGHGHGCSTCGFAHASWLHGGWFRGHTWFHGHGHATSGCSSCGGIAVAAPAVPTGDAVARYAGVGNPGQSAVFYAATPTLDPAVAVRPVSAQVK